MMNNTIFPAVQKNLEKNTPFKLEVGEQVPCVQDERQIDSRVKLTIPNKTLEFWAEMKTEIRTHQLPMIYGKAETFKPFLLIAREIFPEIKEKLRKKGINWIDGAGNLYINTGDHFLFVDNNQMIQVNREKDRAFTKTGLKVLFLFLQDDLWLQRTYRDIAEAAGVALGTIGYVMNGLKHKRYLVKKDDKNFRLVRKKELIDDWMTAFETELMPKLHKGNFTFIDSTLAPNWKTLELGDQTVWGGEAAGELLTGMLKPQILTLYTIRNKGDIMKDFKLKPDPNGNVQVYEPYWTMKTDKKTAPPLTVYTDLMLTGDERNFKIAEQIYGEFIQN